MNPTSHSRPFYGTFRCDILPNEHRKCSVQGLISAKASADIRRVESLELNDAAIRKALIHNLMNQPASPRGIIEELWVHNGDAIADVVALNSEAHCYEIKGCNDKIERIIVQGSYFNSCFRRISLVTTDRGLAKSLKISPDFWGIMVARVEGTEVQLHEIRRARNNPNFTKHLAALTLWKSEMLSLLQDQSHRRKPRATLAHLIASNNGKIELSIHICELLVARSRVAHSERQSRNHIGDMSIHRRFNDGGRRAILA
jgi:hypothetical protein